MNRLVGAIAAALLLTMLAVPSAQAAARVTVSGPPSASGPTTLTVSGTGFQSVPKAMGGIYVLFGTVDDPGGGSWRPSSGGASGSTFRYIPDSESRDNQGYQRFVAFPGSSTQDAANGGEISAAGTWSTTLTVPGPVITVTGRGGGTEQVDCRTTTCGVITVGAHGVKNATNETFTPVRFAAPATAAAAGDSPAAAAPQAAVATPGELAVGVDAATAVAGRVMSFTARGFQPGEQVTAALDDGLAAVGPLVAGTQGEVAAVMQLPSDLRVGTHVLRVAGAASARTAQAEFPVTASQTAAALEAQTQPAAAPGMSPAWLAVVGAALVLVFVVLVGLFGAAGRRRTGRPGPVAEGAAS